MTTAKDAQGLKKRLDSFVWSNRSPEAVALRELLDTHFRPFDSIGAVGGLVRDIARGGRKAFKSDIDLVIDAPPDDVAALAAKVGAKANRFGGYGYKAGPWLIDFWALDRTWAVAEGHVVIRSMADVIRCTFFDWDSAVYDVREKRVHLAPGYLDRIRRGRIDINLRRNPGEAGNLLRAARRILRWELDPGPSLSNFIRENLDDSRLEVLKAMECRKHDDPILRAYDRAELLRKALLAPKDRPDGDQLKLDLFLD